MELLASLGYDLAGVLPGAHDGTRAFASGPERPILCPATGKVLATIQMASEADLEVVMAAARRSFLAWREVPAPRRGALARELGAELRRHRGGLARLISLEAGKIASEAEGEVQEMIDMADFVVGLSRQLYGLTIASERPGHRMHETWHPLGPIGVITSFNFPMAVWAWNALMACVCGDPTVWKPSEKTPLCALAVQALAARVASDAGQSGLFTLAAGDASLGARLAGDRRLPLVSATGSCRMGRAVGRAVAGRLGRSLLELGGNNAAIVLADADLEVATRAILFAAAGTAGQRCTTLRRLIVEESILEEVTDRLRSAYQSLAERLGDPLDPGTLVGPLIDAAAVESFERAIERIRQEGGQVIQGGKRVSAERLPASLRGGFFVEPTLVRARADLPVAREETFAPILYLFPARSLEEAIEIQNSVDQGLASAIFTRSLRAAERFLGPSGSDCGLANVNLGTSGAEIGGAFGGEKETGGGRESGSDAWKSYMRRQTAVVNSGDDLPLAQGVRFDLTQPPPIPS